MNKIALLILPFLIFATSIFSESRYALVIGNGSYSKALGSLKNPVNDALDIAKTLSETDFDVTTVTNGSRRDIMQSIRNFQKKISDGDTALFYYSGHGVQVDGINYLIPIGADLVYESDAEFEAIEMDYVLSSLEKSGSLRNIIIFDACRNNELQKDNKTVTRGLAIIQRKLPESIIIYSTSPGEVAMDGKGRNSPFATSLIANLKTPNLELDSLIKVVTKDVKKYTGFQTPWRSSSLTEDFFFVKKANYKAPINNTIIFEELYGSMQISVEEAGDLYLNGKMVKSFKKRESIKIPKLTTGNYNLEYRSNSNIERKSITVTENNISRVRFLGEVITKQIKSSIEMVLVKVGSFQMGNDSGNSDEKPDHSVTISKDYYIGKYEVTQKQWKAVMSNNPSGFKGDNLPVEKVSWYDVIDFCNKLSKKEGLTPNYNISGIYITINRNANGYRLPTEAQWEFAAKGGNSSRGYKYAGSNSAGDVGWYKDNTGKKTHNVGTKTANELGIYDMSGNVWEWCWDWYGSYSNSNQTDPQGSSSGSNRVMRGGCWYYYASNARSANRGSNLPDGRDDILGFRLVRPVQ